jgi:hypothetical protein
MSAGDRNYNHVGDAEEDGNHWIRLGATASAKLLMLLVKYHSRKTAPAPPSKDAVTIKGSGHG